MNSSYRTQFKSGVFLKYFVYHLLFYYVNPIVAVPVIYVMEGFNTNALYNMSFIGHQRLFYMQLIQSMFVMGFYYYMYLLVQEGNEINLYNFVHVITILTSRCIIIGVKYGYLSNEHLYLIST